MSRGVMKQRIRRNLIKLSIRRRKQRKPMIWQA